MLLENRRVRSMLRVIVPVTLRGHSLGAKEQWNGALYIYTPHCGEEATLDDSMGIDPLVAIGDRERMLIEFLGRDGGVAAVIKKPFRRRYLLREIIPKKFWPDSATPSREIRLRLRLESHQARYLSQPTYFFTLQERKPAASDNLRRKYCLVPWKRGRLGGRNAAPCRRLVRNFHLPMHDKAATYDPWNGDTMIALRESLVRGENKYCFPGCPHFANCEPEEMHRKSGFTGDRVIGENIDLARREYLEGQTRVESKPVILVVKLGTACDNYCTFCSIHETRSPFAISGRTLELANEKFPYARQVLFTGGEPLLLAKHVQRITAGHAPQVGKEIRFNTNGVLVKDRLDMLSEFDDLTLSISLNTPCPETYRQLHGTDSFDKVLEGIRQIRRARGEKKTTIHLKMLVMRSTYRQIGDFSRLAADLGVDTVLFRHLRWYERLKIDVSEKLMPGDAAREEALAAIDSARVDLAARGTKVLPFFLDGRADDVT